MSDTPSSVLPPGPADHPLDDLPAMISGELPPETEERVAEHLAGCDACRRELALVAHLSSLLRDAARLPFAEPVELPPLRLPSAVEVDAARASVRRRRGRWLAGSAAGVLVVGGAIGGGIAASSGGRPPTAVVSLVAVPGGTGAGSTGTAAMNGAGAAQTMSVRAHGLAAPPGLDFYEVWLLNTKTNAILPVGVLPDTGTGRYSLPAARVAGYNAIDISLEPNDNNPAHSGDSVLRGTIS